MERSEEYGALFLWFCYLGMFLWALYDGRNWGPIQRAYMNGGILLILGLFLYGWYSERKEVVIDPNS